MGSTTVDCLPMNSYGAGGSATQVVALLPSNTPVGDGTLVLRYNDVPSAAAPIKVVQRAFGMTALNAGGSGPAVITDGSYQVKLVTQSAAPGQDVVLWGTGLGAITGNEAAGAPYFDMRAAANVAVYVGGQQANVAFAGRAPGAVGLDQVNFTVPQGLSGCYVPLVVTVGGQPSNWTTISIANGGGPCSDDNGLSAAEIQGAQTRGSLKLGTVDLVRNSMSMTMPGFGTFTTVNDIANAQFARYDAGGMISAQGLGGFGSTGSCVVYQFAGQAAADPVVPPGLDAGAQLQLNGPGGQKFIPQTAGEKGHYSAVLGTDNGFTPPTLFLTPGNYTASGPGGADVGTFSATLTVPQPFTWTNQASINNVARNQSLQVTWSGGPANGIVTIMGSSTITTPLAAGATFMCTAPAAAGQFTIPAMVLSALPVSEMDQGVPTGQLALGTATPPVRFNATGIDIGIFTDTTYTGKLIAYQ